MNEQRRRDGLKRAMFSAVTSIALMGAFATLLFHAYRNEISPLFGYQGLAFREPDPWGVAVSFLAACFVVLALPQKIRRPSDFVLWLVFIIAAAPAILIAQYAPVVEPDDATILGLNVAGAILIARIVTAHGGPRRLMPNLQATLGRHFWLILTGLTVATYALMVAYRGTDLTFAPLSNVYDVRSDFATKTAGAPILGYLLPAQHNVINPIFIARGVYARKFWLLAGGVGGQLWIYGSTGQKTVLFSSLAIFAAAWVFRGRREPTGSQVLIATTVGAAGALALDKLLGSIMLTSLFVRRFLVVPGLLTAAYVAVFTGLPKTNFADSILPFLNNPYEGFINPVHIVGEAFVGNASTAANVSLFGHGFLSAGYLGMYVEAIVLSIALWLVDNSCEGMPPRVCAVIFIMPSIAIASASIFTVLLTHGLLLATVLLAAAPRDGWGPPSGASDRPGSAESQLDGCRQEQAAVKGQQRTARLPEGRPDFRSL